MSLPSQQITGQALPTTTQKETHLIPASDAWGTPLNLQSSTNTNNPLPTQHKKLSYKENKVLLQPSAAAVFSISSHLQYEFHELASFLLKKSLDTSDLKTQQEAARILTELKQEAKKRIIHYQLGCLTGEHVTIFAGQGQKWAGILQNAVLLMDMKGPCFDLSIKADGNTYGIRTGHQLLVDGICQIFPGQF